jgi:hypothetical protein
MRERSASPRRLAWVLVVFAVFSAAHARGVDPSALPHRYLGGSGPDRGLVTATNPLDGRVWSAWAYRSGAEFDVAVSVQDTNGAWSEPVFVGRGDGLDQVDPALTFDAAGNLYLAHVDRPSGELRVSMLAAGATRMTSSVVVSSPGERTAAPTLMVTGPYLMVGYRVGPRVMLRSVSLAPTTRPFGVQDGPDGFPPTRGETDGGPDGSTNGVGL